MTGVADRLAARAAAHYRYYEARQRWAPDRIHWRVFKYTAAGAVEAFTAWVLGWRPTAPAGLEAPAGAVLSGVSVTPCETGHQWPASVTVVISDGGPEGRVVHVCADCACALQDAGVTQ